VTACQAPVDPYVTRVRQDREIKPHNSLKTALQKRHRSPLYCGTNCYSPITALRLLAQRCGFSPQLHYLNRVNTEAARLPLHWLY
jgi:hypothetical protein